MKTKEELNAFLNKGIHCPICGMALIDLQHDGYDGLDPDYHEYFCTQCHITIEITTENL